MRFLPGPVIIVFLAAVLVQPHTCHGREEAGPGTDASTEERDKPSRAIKSSDQIATELASQVNTLFYLDNDIEFRSYEGDLPESGDQSAWIFRFTTYFPIALENGKSILLRASLPWYTDQPVWVVDYGHPAWEYDTEYADWNLRQSPQITADSGSFYPGFAHDHIANLSLAAAYGGVSDSGFISSFGFVTVLPTSQDLSARRNQWLLGPEIVLGKTADWGVFSARATHLTRMSGEDRWDTNETHIDLSFAYGLGNGWQIISSPTLLYDWEADSGNEWLLPIGGGVAKTTRVGHTPLRMAVELERYIVTPDRFGPEWLFTFRITPVFMDRSLN